VSICRGIIFGCWSLICLLVAGTVILGATLGDCFAHQACHANANRTVDLALGVGFVAWLVVGAGMIRSWNRDV
jgi:hypothetical protein